MSTTNGYTVSEMLSAFGVSIPKTASIDDYASKLTRHPARNTFAIVAASAAAFYAAEKGHNPKVKDIYDALVYTSTCLNVGYGDIFAKTPAGKLIGTFLMSIGPSLASRTLDGQAGSSDDVQLKILSTLNELLSAFKAMPAGRSGPP